MFGDEHIGRLDVAVNNPLVVGVLNRSAGIAKQFQTLADRHPDLIAVLRDRNAANEFHHEEGCARGGGPRIEYASDVGVVHHRQGLTLGLEAGDDLPRVHAGADHFQRHFAADRLRLPGQVDDPHSPFADQLNQPIGTDLILDARSPGTRSLRAS